MAMRKEQVLVLAAAALGLLVWKSGAGADWRAPTLSITKIDYEATPVPDAPLIEGAPAATPQRRWFREPSETQPLPPRDLPFPARPPAALVALPLDPGPDLARADLLRLPGDVVADVVLQPTGSNGAAEPPVETGGGDVVGGPMSTRQEKEARYAKIYDRVTVGGQVHFGVLRAPGMDPLELEARAEFEGVVVHLLEFSLAKERLILPEATFGSDARQPITRIQLADTMRNIVAREVRSVPENAAHVADRLELLDRLLLMARQDGSVYDEALRQVAVLEQTAAGLVAQRAKARVLFAKGDVAGEFDVYHGITAADGPEGAFRHEGLGNLQARLGLFEAAERDLRRAVELQPTDARPHASLAAFLRRLGRPREAAQAAAQALAAVGSVVDAIDRQRIAMVVVSCLLAIGDVDGARQAQQSIQFGSGREAQALASFLRASIDYTAGDVAAARDGYRSAAAGGHGPTAQLGLAACQVRLGEWQEALAGFEAVVDQAPLLRHRALTGLALLHLRLGQYDAANTALDRALEAAPADAYATFLRARVQQEQGQAVSALETLAQVLRLRDDFVAAVSAVSDLRLHMFREGDVADQASSALAAMRYADRAVALAAVPDQDLYERQGLAHFAGADLRGAGAAFAQARDVAPNEGARLFAQAALAVVDYAQDHVDDALAQLERLQEGLLRDHPMRQWAVATVALIDDHAQKEQLDDRFERDEVGNIWITNRDGGLGPEIQEHRLVLRGRFSKGNAEVAAARANAVQKAGRFLAAACRMQLGAAHGQESFTGLRIQTRGGGQNSDFAAQIGCRNGRLYWQVKEGREDPVRAANDIEFGAGVHQVELRVEDRGEKLFRLLLVFDGAVVGQKDLSMLRASDQGRELEVALVAIAENRPGEVDVRFDDFHLERRKD